MIFFVETIFVAMNYSFCIYVNHQEYEITQELCDLSLATMEGTLIGTTNIKFVCITKMVESEGSKRWKIMLEQNVITLRERYDKLLAKLKKK